MEFRRLFAGSISGTVYGDYNHDGTHDSAEPGLANWSVYLDSNDNGLKDAGEQSAATNSEGAYQFTNLPAGNYVVRQILPAGWEQTGPVSAAPVPAEAIPQPAAVTFSQSEVLFASKDRYPLRQLQSYLQSHLYDFGGSIDFEESTHVLRSRGETIVKLHIRGSTDIRRIVGDLAKLDFVRWASPNYLYASRREYTPSDPIYSSQYHHAIMQNPAAWEITRGDPSVVIAVVDEGVDWTHPDLSANIWSNPGEIAGNHVDDDHNGYIDDIRGWDVVDNDNNPGPDVPSQSHGTHVAGIAAARIDNGVGIAGVAGRSTIMPIRVIDPARSFSSTVLATAYRYAADNGARIVISSYNTDEFVNDPVYKAGLQYLYDHGAMHFNSAGNSNYADPPRQAFEQSILVASTDATDTRNSTSNYGWGIDLSAPGTSILSTIPDNGYAYFGGTSMATPAAAGVAALIWAAFPQYTREQVTARLLGLTDSIDSLNVGFIGKLGSGRVNSYRALTGSLPAPKFRADSLIGLPVSNGTTQASPSSFSIDLANVFSTASINSPANWKLTGDGPDNMFGTGDDVSVPLTLQTSYAVGTNRLNFTMPPLASDRYRFVAVSGVSALRDPFNQPLDGNADGVPGGDFVHEFTVLSPPAAARVSLSTNQQLIGIEFAAVDRNPLRINSASYAYIASQSLTLSFNKPGVSQLLAADILLTNLTTGVAVDSSGFAVEIDQGGKFQTIRFATQPPLLPDGRYVITIKTGHLQDSFRNALPSEYRFGFFVLGADANRDATVDSIDFNLLASNYGSTNALFLSGDFNFDRRVDTADFNILAGNWGRTLATVTA